jgi:hypothetical protein
MAEKLCRNCGKPFEPKKPHYITCSWPCQVAYQQQRDDTLAHLPEAVREAVERMERENPPPEIEKHPF